MRFPFQAQSLVFVSMAFFAGCNLQESAVPVSQDPVSTQARALSKSGVPADPAWEHAAAVQNAHARSIFSREGVVGTGLGMDASGSPVVVVFTERPGVRGLPASLDGVPVLVEVSGKVEALQGKGKPGGGGGGGGCTADPKTRFARPVPIGVSIGHPDITAGTLGARAKDAAGNLFILSNNHVLANSNAAAAGDLALQPGPYDGGAAPGDAVGTLADFQPIVFCDASGTVCPENRLDAAIAATTSSEVGNATPCNGYGVPKSAPVAAAARMKVKKYGRTTGLTSGSVFAVNVSIKVGYGPGQTALFTGQIYINRSGFSAGGDSGSLIVSEQGNPVALLFAGSSSSTIGNPIGEALSRFGVSVDGT